jgi:hypothetical protein
MLVARKVSGRQNDADYARDFAAFRTVAKELPATSGKALLRISSRPISRQSRSFRRSSFQRAETPCRIEKKDALTGALASASKCRARKSDVCIKRDLGKLGTFGNGNTRLL